jgi:hypothetical protein
MKLTIFSFTSFSGGSRRLVMELGIPNDVLVGCVSHSCAGSTLHFTSGVQGRECICIEFCSLSSFSEEQIAGGVQ